MSRNLCSVFTTAVACAALGLGSTSCGGGSSSPAAADLVLLGFSQPNVAGVALNQPLIFTFSAPIDESSITPDTLRVVGQVGPFFEDTVVDGNLIALLPRSPNFDNMADTGLAPATTYQVSMPTFPAVDTIESVAGKPLLSASTYNFTTVPATALVAVPRFAFVEPRRRLEHGVPPATGRSDDNGCLQNRVNELFIDPTTLASTDPYPQQTNSLPGGRLLCLENEGPPRILWQQLTPFHSQPAVGTPSAGSQNIGKIDLPQITIYFNEQVDPGTIGRPYDVLTLLANNVRLYRVAGLDGVPIPAEPIEINVPTVVQEIGDVKANVVATGPVLQGIYMVLVTPNVLDLTQKPLYYQDSPHLTGQLVGTVYQGINAALPAAIPQGYRYFFQTLQLPSTASAISESWGSNIAEWGDQFSSNSEPGIFTQSTPPLDPVTAMSGITPVGFSQPSFTLQYGTHAGPSLACGQTTTANWNNGFRFLNLNTLEVNTEADAGLGRLKAVWKPYLGDGGDGVMDTGAGTFLPGPGDVLSLSTTPGGNASADGDGIYEYQSFFLRQGDTLTVSGIRPLVILCRGSFEVDGTILMNGHRGGPGLDTDGSTDYSNPGAVPQYGDGGQPGPGGGLGGRGAGPYPVPAYAASVGGPPSTVFGLESGLGGGGGVSRDLVLPEGGPTGGGGGGFGGVGSAGMSQGDVGDGNGVLGTNGGGLFGTPLMERAPSLYTPDRGYATQMGTTGGLGGGGGGLQDDVIIGSAENGDDGGGGGGGGGGALCVLSGGLVRVGGTALIQANGGAGGDTYDRDNQALSFGPDNAVGGGDDVIVGLIAGAIPSGAGAPGGGGSGGGIMLVGEAGVTIQANATLQALGGPGGVAADPDLVGGEGGLGRILLMGGASPPTLVNVASVNVSPAAVTESYRPTIKLDSVGQSGWIDMFVNTVKFNPDPDGLGPTLPQVPFGTTNWAFLTGGGLIMGEASDFDAVFEYQGAVTLTPTPDVGSPTVATGLTQWTTNIALCDNHRYFRYRCRFHVANTFPGMGVTAAPMPAVLDWTIPFMK